MDIVNTYSKSQIDAVVDVSTDVEVVLSNIAFVGTIKAETFGRNTIPLFIYIIPVQIITEEVVQLATGNIRSTKIGHVDDCLVRLNLLLGFIDIVQVALRPGQLVERGIAQLVGC